MGKKYVPLIGYIDDYVGRSRWDFYSWGHLALGISSFLLLSLINTIPDWLYGPGVSIIPWWLIMVAILFIALLWEFIENVILWKMGMKFENRRDSFLNFLWDVILACIGGGIMWLCKWIIMDLSGLAGRRFYITGIGVFVLVIIAYLIGYLITNENTKKARKEQ